eukprot:IDg23574t1
MECIRSEVEAADYLVLMFDGWSTVRNEGVLGCMVSFLDSNFVFKTNDETELDDLDDDGLIKMVELLSESNSYKRLTMTVRAIKKAIRHSHTRMQLFDNLQTSVGVKRTIVVDVPTRFDSTVDMLESVLINKPVLLRLQEKGKREPDVWPFAPHLSADDFELMHHIVEVLKLVRSATKELSSEFTILSDVVPTFSYKDLPFLGGRKYAGVLPNEYVASSFMDPRYYNVMRACYRYSESAVVTELSRIYQEKIGSESQESDSDVEQESSYSSNDGLDQDTIQSWFESFNDSRSNKRRSKGLRKPSVRNEFAQFVSDISENQFTRNEANEFWKRARNNKAYPILELIARLFMTVPASAIPQERHFSE